MPSFMVMEMQINGIPLKKVIYNISKVAVEFF